MLQKEELAYYKSLTKKFSVLHVKNKEEFCVCKDFFEKVYLVDNHNQAIDLYKEKKADMVFIDVDTKDLSWLRLVTALRKIAYDLPIAIITDLSNSDRLTTAITLGITQCIFKPIDPKRLELVIYDMVNKLQNKLDAKELFYKKEQEKLSDVATQTAQDIIQNMINPMFVFTKERLLFANKEIYKLFEAKKIKLQNTLSFGDIEKLFENYTEQNSFSSIKLGRSLDVQYHYKDYSLKKVFVPNKFIVQIKGVQDTCYVIVLNDIASFLMQVKMLDYQNNKLTNYKNLVEELLAKQMFHLSGESIAKQVQKSEPTPITPSVSAQISNTVDKKLNDKDIKILRKSVAYKIASWDYVRDVDADSLEDIQELYSVEEDLQVAIDSYVVSQSGEDLKTVAKLFRVYGNVINALMEFVDLGNSIYSLSNFLHELSYEADSVNAEKVSIYIENVLHDLSSWRENIFEKQIAEDIHYLDSSIFSSVLQLQLTLNQDDDEGGDFELF